MGAGHSHAPSGSEQHRWRLALVFALTAAFFVVELLAGIVAESLSLLGDAGHMAADVVTLGAALVATRIATRPDTTGKRTFGSYRAEVFASGFAVLMMLGVSVYTGVEAIGRLMGSGEPDSASLSTTMFVVGLIGLAVNAVGVLILRAGASDSLNVKGAYLEVVADAVGSLGVVLAAVLIRLTGSSIWDGIVALAIAVFVAWRAISLGREVIAVLGQHAPEGKEPDAVLSALQSCPGVDEVHDLHVWRLTSGMDVATAHVVTSADQQTVLRDAGLLLREQFGIEHATLQVEAEVNHACEHVTW